MQGVRDFAKVDMRHRFAKVWKIKTLQTVSLRSGHRGSSCHYEPGLSCLLAFVKEAEVTKKGGRLICDRFTSLPITKGSLVHLLARISPPSATQRFRPELITM
jgi:hypothetical protein